MNAMITKTSPELAQGFRDLVAGGGVATTDAAKALVLKTGGKAIDEVRKVLGKENPGVKDIVGGVNNLKDAVKSGTKQFRGVAQYAGDANNALKGYAEAQNFANDAQVTEEDYKKIKKAMKDNVDGSNKQTKQLSETEMNLRDASIKMSLFATNAEIVNTAMETMSEGLDWISEKLFELSGQEMPEDFKARREERKSIQALSKERKELIELEKQAQKLAEEDNNGETKTKEYNRRLHGEMRKLDAQIAKKRESVIKADSVAKQATETRQQSAGMSPQEKRAEAVKNASSATGGTTGGGGQDTGKEESKDSKQQVKTPDAEKVSAALNDDKVIKSLFNFSGNVAGKLENFQKLDEDMKRRLVTAALEYREQTGGKGRLTINSAARSNEDQKKIAGGDRGKYAAKPGQSLHERGLAVDIQEYRDDKAMAALSRQGLTNQKVAGEPWHFQKISARQGFEGFVEGPQEGYKPDIELHGREKVKIEKDGENSTAELIKTFKELMTAMLEKQDDMLEHLETSAYNSEKLVRATV
jgi:LAS superfamily LD-carboxypeptidase LdcB